jgi:membrane protein YqaA with SNARE-associated domain
MFRKLYDWTLAWGASRHAEKALAASSFAESSFFPIPADVLFIPMCLARPDAAMRFATIATVTSVLGGIFGWWIGHFAFQTLAAPLLELYGKMDAFTALRDQTGNGAILLMLITSGATHLPPMKVVTILSGVVSFDLKWFIASAIVARGGRFFLLAYVLRRYGAQVLSFVERRLPWVAAAGIGALAALWAVLHYA